jgi:hypothetical protein
MFRRPDLPGSVRAMAFYDLREGAAIFDLDDARSLQTLGLRPSQVVTRDREVTRLWALTIFEQRKWSGVRWWSYYDPRWHSYAVWDIASLRVSPGSIRALSIDDPALVEAAKELRRPRHR